MIEDQGNPTDRATMTKTTVNDHRDGTIMDVDLFKFIGLYRLLHKSSTTNGCWATGDWYRTLLMSLIWLSCSLMSLQIVRLYLILDNLPQFLLVGMTITVTLASMFNGYVLVKHADRLLVVKDLTRYSFTACSHRDPSHLRQHGDETCPRLRAFVRLSLVVLTLWIVTPFCLHEHVPYVKLDGNVGHYRPSVFNVWLPLSETVYNWTPVWALIYVIETIPCASIILFSMMFTTYIVTMCIGLNAHLHTITAAYETLGGDDLQTHQRQGIRTESEYYDELILIIKCNQKVLKIYDELFDILQPPVIVRIMNDMYSLVSVIFSCIQLCLTGSSIMSIPVWTLFMSYVTYTIQLYFLCYVFDNLETTKSNLNNGLWNCKWIDRDLKFKKSVLMAMSMNSAHKRKMKISPNSTINLEMFARSMRMSYSILSVLMNTRDKYT